VTGPWLARLQAAARRPGPAQFWTGFWALVAALVPIMRAQGIPEISELFRGFRLAILAALVASALLGLTARPAGWPVWRAAGVLIPLAGLVSGLAGSLSASVVAAVQLALLCALGPAVLRYHVRSTPGFRVWVLGAFLASQTLSAGLGLYLLLVSGPGALFRRASGLAGHPNMLGLQCVLALLVILAVAGRVGAPARAGLGAAFAVNAAALVVSGSFTAVLAGVVAAAVLAVGRRRVRLAVHVGLAAALTVAVGWLAGSGLVAFLTRRVIIVTGQKQSGEDGSLTIRLDTYRWALAHLARDPVLGVGMDEGHSGTFDGQTVVHNYLLHAWYQGGLLLLFWFVAVTAVLLVAVVGAMRSGHGLGGATVVTALLTFGATSAFLAQPYYWLPLLLAVATLPDPAATAPAADGAAAGAAALGPASAGRRPRSRRRPGDRPGAAPSPGVR
jgi:O-antigen ligase